MLEKTILLALATTFVLMLLDKWNYFEKFRIRFKVEPCFFCHTFWISNLILWCAYSLGFFTMNWIECLVIIVCANPLAYKIYMR